ncbi:hypothetical protein LguiA_006363 [Lonicera macranthoides]
MKSIGVRALLVFILLCMVLTVVKSLPPHHHHFTYHGKGTPSDDRSETYSEEGRREEIGMELYSTGGSSLPDCSHACGACYPCKRVMVSFKCSIAEPCPIVYRCMCKGKYYHVPSN